MDSKPQLSDLRSRGHSYRNYSPGEMMDILDAAEEAGPTEYEETKREMRAFFEFIESGRFNPMLEATSKMYRALDPDERRTFWKRNPGLMAWVRVYNRIQDLMVWEKYAPDGWEDFNSL